MHLTQERIVNKLELPSYFLPTAITMTSFTYKGQPSPNKKLTCTQPSSSAKNGSSRLVLSEQSRTYMMKEALTN